MRQKKTVTREVVSRYRRSSKKIKGQILDEFIQLTKYKRNYASWILRNYGREIFTRIDGQWVKIIVGKARKKEPRKRPGKYDDKVLKL